MVQPYPPGFFDRTDESADPAFYEPDRLVTHIDEAAIAAVGDLYADLRVDGRVLDLMGSWVSHFAQPPDHLTVLGMNPQELEANPMATERVQHDLNRDPTLPFVDASFDDAVCCVSVDYLTRPIEVFAEVARVLRPGGRFVVTWSNRCFPTKADQRLADGRPRRPPATSCGRTSTGRSDSATSSPTAGSSPAASAIPSTPPGPPAPTRTPARPRPDPAPPETWATTPPMCG